MIVSVGGGRKFDNAKKMYKLLNNLDQFGFPEEITMIVSGMAHGADQLAYGYAKKHGITFSGHPPLAEEVKTMGFARAAMRRNTRVVAHTDLFVAFPDKDSRGTWQAVRLAEKLGIPCLVYKEWEGKVNLYRNN